MKSEQIRKLVRLAVLSAIAVVLVAFVHFPLFASAPYLEYDPADAPVLIAGLMYGPWEGVAVTVVTAVIQGLTVSSGSGIIGIIMHILATSCFVLATAFCSRKTNKVLSLIAGTIVMGLAMCVCNLIFTPIYTGTSVAAIASMLLPVILPFNLVKAGINSVIAFIVNTALEKVFSKKQ